MPTHVDDIMWASFPGWESIVQDFLKKFEVQKVTQDEFRLCGQEYVQDEELTYLLLAQTTWRRFSL
eukprot:6705942-Karenia_brevis.AAC.1